MRAIKIQEIYGYLANGIPKDLTTPRVDPTDRQEDIENILLQFTNVFDVVLDEVLARQEVHTLSALAIVDDKYNVFRKVRTYLLRMDRIPPRCNLYETDIDKWLETRKTKSLFFTHAL